MRWAEFSDTCQMDAAGRLAQVRAFQAEHPTSPLMSDSGKKFKKSGDKKAKSRIIYEAAFDAEGHEMKIVNPASRRLD